MHPPNRRLPHVLVVLLVFGIIAKAQEPTAKALDKARDEYVAGVRILDQKFRERVAELILKGTRVELMLLDFSLGEEGRDKKPLSSFLIAPYLKNTGILQHRLCTANERQELLPVLSKAISGIPSNGGVACHFPIHGLRVWIDNEVIFETSICWHCSNYWFPYFSGPGWTNHSAGFDDLKPLLQKMMPIPEEEVTRFKKKYEDEPDGR